MSNWYLIFNGQQTGPMEREELARYNLTPDTMVWTEGMPDWLPAGQVTSLYDLLYGASNPSYSNPPQPNAFRQGYQAGYQERGYEDAHGRYNSYPPYQRSGGKSKVAAGILAILLGGLGVQYFYLGKVGGGFITILLTLVTCGAWEVITLIQGILMLTMSEEEFDRKFVFTDKTFPLF